MEYPVSSSKRDISLDKPSSLPLMEQFYTIQGEGYHQGKPAVFIRLAGCDVGCHWCDVKDSWDIGQHPMVTIEKIAREANKSPAKICVITGGEPLMHNLDDLCETLHKLDKKTHIETSGAHPMSGEWDWICLSPKKFKQPLPQICDIAHELKVVIYNKSDFQWAECYARKVNPHCLLFLQPEWSRCQEMMPDIVNYVKQNPQWQISLQTHKYMEVP